MPKGALILAEHDRNLAYLHRIAGGDEAAMAALVEENMGLVRSIALRFKDRGTEYEDLVQIGVIGMIKAAKSFDFSYDTVFSTYRESEGKNFVRMEKPYADATMELRTFLFENVYGDKIFKDEEMRADKMISALYEYYKNNLKKLPEFYYNRLDMDGVDVALTDYISGMSDIFAVKTFTEIFIPNNWKM